MTRKHPGAASVNILRCSPSRQPRTSRGQRNRILSGLALGYTPQGTLRIWSGSRAVCDRRVAICVLLHATARAEKQWPEAHWIALGKALGHDTWPGNKTGVALGQRAERARSERIAADAARCERSRAGAARSGREADCRRTICRRRRYRTDASCRRVRRSAGCDLHRQQSWSDRAGREWADHRARRHGAPPSVDAVVDAVAKVARPV